MSHARAFLIAFAALLASPLCAAAQPQPGKFEMVKLAEGVYAAIRAEPLADPVDGNSVVIVNEEDVVVVDTNITPASARAVIAEIKKITPKPVRYVVNTHWHNDHVTGNAAYREAYPQVDFIAHANTLADTLEIMLPQNKKFLDDAPKNIAALEERLAKGVRRDGTPMTEKDKQEVKAYVEMFKGYMAEARGYTYVPATVTVERELVLHRAGGREIRLMHLGRGNTRGDLVVYLPKERVLVTGDLVVNPIPFSFGSYLGEWIETLRKLRALPADVIVTGHGPVQRDKAYIETVGALLESTLSQARDAVKRGLTLEETRKAVNLESFMKKFAGDDPARRRAFEGFFVAPAVERAYKEAKGEPLTPDPSVN
jgi:glyoxylase-like metal-dependent hydrolase (beta-lactamase superfamily II)